MVKFYGEFQGGKRNKWLDFGSDLGHHADFQLEVWPLLNKFWADFDDFFFFFFFFHDKLCNDTRNNWFIFGGDLDHYMLTPNPKSRKYGGNELPGPRRSALSLCSLVMCWVFFTVFQNGNLLRSPRGPRSLHDMPNMQHENPLQKSAGSSFKVQEGELVEENVL